MLGHRNLPWPIGFSIDGTDINDTMLEIEVSLLKREQFIPAKSGISGNDDYGAQMNASAFPFPNTDM